MTQRRHSARLLLKKGVNDDAGALGRLNDLIDDAQAEPKAAAKSGKTVIDVSTDPTDTTTALPQEQKDTPSVSELNSFLQILEEGVCKTIHKDFREDDQVCISEAA